jgi:predicted O-methyltransferase YrrM
MTVAEPRWQEVDDYYGGLYSPDDPVLRSTLESIVAAGMPAISVSPLQGKLLWMLATVTGARRILEVGTLGGYSTIWLARALPPGGRLVTLEISPEHAAVARANLEVAGLADRVDVVVAPAAGTLRRLADDGTDPFDLVFIDADKQGYPEYLPLCVELTRPGGLIVSDNVVRNGAVVDADSEDPTVVGIRRFNEVAAADPRLTTTVLQTVGSKGYDGFAVSLVGTG